MSSLEKYMYDLLCQLKNSNQITNFNYQERFDWCNFYNPFTSKNTFGIYDFVIEERKLIIETDGGFHRKDNKMSGQTKEESRFRDNKKDYLAIIHGYDIVRITDEGDLKTNILFSKLADIFDFSKIEWEHCIKIAYTNMIKKVCDFKRNHPDYTVKKISKEFHIGEELTRSWLKIGNSLGWCEHNGHITREVICIETKKIYKSAKSCLDEFYLLDSKFNISNIRNSLRSRGKHACFGYHFVYLDEYNRIT